MEPKYIIRACQEMKAACDDEIIHRIADAMLSSPAHYDRAVFLAMFGSKVMSPAQRIDAYLAQSAIERLAQEFKDADAEIIRPKLGEVLQAWFDRQPLWIQRVCLSVIGLLVVSVYWSAAIIGEVFFGG